MVQELPHTVPSVSRLQGSLRLAVEHEPLEHTWSVHVREPVSSQVLEYPPQESHVVEPQEDPSVSRVQLWLWVLVLDWHSDATHE